MNYTCFLEWVLLLIYLLTRPPYHVLALLLLADLEFDGLNRLHLWNYQYIYTISFAIFSAIQTFYCIFYIFTWDFMAFWFAFIFITLIFNQIIYFYFCCIYIVIFNAVVQCTINRTKIISYCCVSIVIINYLCGNFFVAF